MSEHFDYVVVGAGSAGCVLANRLSAEPACRVLVLEAGPPDTSIWVRMPAAFPFAMGSRRLDWGYVSEVEPHLHGRRMPYPRGKVLGGSSSINAMCFTRGHPLDFDGWAGNGLPEWSYAHCLPYFKRMETFSGGANAWRGGDGPLQVTAPAFSSPLYEVFLEACEQAGYPSSSDINNGTQEGFGRADQTIHRGRRVSAASAYLAPVATRSNLTVRTGALVRRVRFDGLRACGVEYDWRGRSMVVEAGVETIVCAGALDSPKLLMLSGIGDDRELSRHGITPVVQLPAVGKHLQDHLDVCLQQACTRPVTTTPALKRHRRVLIGLRWLLSRRGEGATNHFEAGGHLRSSDALAVPDLLTWFCPLIANPDGTRAEVEHGYQIALMQMRPEGRGTVGLRSADPRDPPRIESRFLDAPGDLRTLREAVKRGREIFAQPAFEPYRGREVAPGVEVGTDAQINDFVRRTAKSTRHPSCTCRMGTDAQTSVVDGEGRVHGVGALRVVDASVMPRIVGAALNAATIMLAEKIADRIRGRAPLEPVFAEAVATTRRAPA